MNYEDSHRCSHLKEIPGSKLLISLQHSLSSCANIEVFSVANKGRPEKIYSFEEVIGCKLATLDHSNKYFLTVVVTGFGDLTYNTKRDYFGAVNVGGKIAYHLFSANTNALNTKEAIKLIRKSKWHPQYGTQTGKLISY